jgi:hypothetical protein
VVLGGLTVEMSTQQNQFIKPTFLSPPLQSFKMRTYRLLILTLLPSILLFLTLTSCYFAFENSHLYEITPLNLNESQNIKFIILNHSPTHMFADQLFPIYEAFLELGISVEWAKDFVPDDHKTIYIFTMAPWLDKVPMHYIIYNWEQMGTDKVWGNDVYDRFKNALEVWDYSMVNVKALREHGINSKIILPGYSISHETEIVSHLENKRDLDFVFIGTMNQRRNDFWGSVKDKSK